MGGRVGGRAGGVTPEKKKKFSFVFWILDEKWGVFFFPSFAAFFLEKISGRRPVVPTCLSFFSGRRPVVPNSSVLSPDQSPQVKAAKRPSAAKWPKAAERPWPRSGQRPRSGLQAAQRPVGERSDHRHTRGSCSEYHGPAGLLRHYVPGGWVDGWAEGWAHGWANGVTPEKKKKNYFCRLDSR